MEFLQPVHVNDQVTVKGKIVDMSEKEGKSGKLVFVTSEFTYTNQKGAVLARHRDRAVAVAQLAAPEPRGASR